MKPRYAKCISLNEDQKNKLEKLQLLDGKLSLPFIFMVGVNLLLEEYKDGK